MKPFYLNLQHSPDGDTAPASGGSAPTTPNADSAAVFSEPTAAPEPPSAAPSAVSPTTPQQSGATPSTPTTPASTSGAVAPIPGTAAAAPTSTPQATLTPEQLATLASTAAQQTVSRMQAPSQAAQTPQFTESDFNKTFRVPVMDAAKFQAITGYAADKPEQVAALHAWGQDLVREALAMGNYQLEQARSAVEGRLNPLLEAQQTQADRAIDNEFFTLHAPYKGVEGLVRTAITDLTRSGARFDTKEQMFSAVTTRVNQLLGPLAANLSTLSANGVAQTATPATTRTMASIPTGGQQSSSQRPATTAGDAKTIFG